MDHVRSPVDGSVQVSWLDADGVRHEVGGRCLDIASSGLGLELSQAVPLEVPVRVRVPFLGVDAPASVCHSEPIGARYAVGVKFSGAKRWDREAGCLMSW